MDTLIILPNQLYNKKYIPKSIKNIIIWEHPQYFTKYNFNKKKLILHRASMKSYDDYLSKYYKVRYIEYKYKCNEKEYYIFDPIDKIKLKNKYKILESPNFLLTNELMDEYRKKTKSFFFHNFYMWSKGKLDIIPKVKSQDKENRKRYEGKEKIPILPRIKNRYIKEAINYVNKNFKSNYGNTDNFNYPITHKEADRWLDSFIKNKFKYFGDYQDFINKDNNTMFHSILSSSINIGLINPKEIIEKIKPLKSKIKLNSYEGYIRQLFWREYQRYCYKYFDFNKTNYFNNKKKLTKKWYNGTLNIKPIDDCIKKGFDTGYLHHIERLMLIGNFMNISRISAKEGLKWFMEFSIDSYEWVMHQNVLDMVFCVSGGQTMRKPYISSSSYVLKMSNYKKGEWSDKWDDLYKSYLKKHKKKLLKDFKYYFHFIKNY
jgi:deoxyribodipyrimidine photolyase-related protein